MIVDTSAIMALLLQEADHDEFNQALTLALRAKISAGTWIELSAVITRKKLEALDSGLERLMTLFAIRVEPTTATQAVIGHAAYREFGQGTGHPARLNFGDCFAYALAKETGEPLLFKGDDFIHTDIVSAL